MSSESSLLLPEGARLVHIGPHKTGSTAIQVGLQAAADELAVHGVHYATGARHRPDKAGWALGIRGRPAGTERPPMKFWHRLVADVAEHPGDRVCISNEDFGRARPDEIRTLVADLGGDAVHVVAVARRFDRYLPSQWQERVKAGDRRAYDEWLRTVLDTSTDEFDWDRRNVWFSHDTAALVGRWVEVVGPERFTLIVSDESDREMLPRTFEALLGLPPGTIKPDPSRSNRGLSWSETELVRAVNDAVTDLGWTRQQRRRFLKGGVLADMQRRPTPPGPKSPPMPDWAMNVVRELSDRRISDLARLGIPVVGDPDVLRVPADEPVAATPLDTPSVEAPIAAAAVAAVMRVAMQLEEDRAGAGAGPDESAPADGESADVG